MGKGVRPTKVVFSKPRAALILAAVLLSSAFHARTAHAGTVNELIQYCLDQYAQIGVDPCMGAPADLTCPVDGGGEALGICCSEVTRTVTGACLQECSYTDRVFHPCDSGSGGSGATTTTADGAGGATTTTDAGTGSSTSTGSDTGSGSATGYLTTTTDSGTGSGTSTGSSTGDPTTTTDSGTGSGTSTGDLTTTTDPGTGSDTSSGTTTGDPTTTTDSGTGSATSSGSTTGDPTTTTDSGAASGTSTGDLTTTTDSGTGSDSGSGSTTGDLTTTTDSGTGSGTSSGSGVGDLSTTTGDVSTTGTATGSGLPTCSFGSCPGVWLMEPCLEGSPETCVPPNISNAGWCSHYNCGSASTTGDPTTTTDSGTGSGSSTGDATTTADAGSGSGSSSDSGTSSGSTTGDTTSTTDSGTGSGSADSTTTGSDTSTATSTGSGVGDLSTTTGLDSTTGTSTGDDLPVCSFGSCPGVFLLEPCLEGSPETCVPPNISNAGWCSNYNCGSANTTGDSTATTDSGTGIGSGTSSGSATGDTTGTTDSGSGSGTGDETTATGSGTSNDVQGGQLTVEAACVAENADGSRTAYFTYINLTSSELLVEPNPTTGVINQLLNDGRELPPLTRFAVGRHEGEFAVTFTGTGLEWTVRPADGGLFTARVDASTTRCQPLKPLAVCARKVVDKRVALIGYENGNPFSMKVPVGTLNKMTPGEEGRGQPELFRPGVNKSVSAVAADDNPTWSLNGATVSLGSSLLQCSAQCLDADTLVTLSNLDSVALELTNVTKRASLALIKARPKKAAPRSVKAAMASAGLDAQRATARSERYLKLAREVTLDWPVVTKGCPDRPTVCAQVDRRQAIMKLRGLYALSRALTARIVIRTKFIKYGERGRSNPLIRKARRLEIIGNEQLNKLSPIVEQCK